MVYIEHTAGAFPTWIAPVQVRILAVVEKFQDYALKVKEVLSEQHIRAEVASPNETLGKRIRQSELEKIPYTIVVGEKEMNAKSVNVRSRKSEKPIEVSIEEFLESIRKEIAAKSY